MSIVHLLLLLLLRTIISSNVIIIILILHNIDISNCQVYLMSDEKQMLYMSIFCITYSTGHSIIHFMLSSDVVYIPVTYSTMMGMMCVCCVFTCSSL